jgi:hypothetical protein
MPDTLLMPPAPMKFFLAKEDAILADLKTRGVPDSVLSIVAAPTPTPTPGPCNGILAGLLQSLLPMLLQCIPVAKTPAGMLSVMQRMNKRLEGLGLRATLASQIRQTILKHAGEDQDGADLLAVLAAPLKASVLQQCGAMVENDCAAMLDEYNALRAA